MTATDLTLLTKETLFYIGVAWLLLNAWLPTGPVATPTAADAAAVVADSAGHAVAQTAAAIRNTADTVGDLLPMGKAPASPVWSNPAPIAAAPAPAAPHRPAPSVAQPAAPLPEPTAPTRTLTTIKVQPGETLASIAQHYATTEAAITAANPGLNPGLLIVGAPLVLPEGAQPAAPMPEPTPTLGSYIAQRGDNLTAIARKLNVSVEVLLGANPQIEDPNTIYAGMPLNMPTANTVARAIQVQRLRSSAALGVPRPHAAEPVPTVMVGSAQDWGTVRRLTSADQQTTLVNLGVEPQETLDVAPLRATPVAVEAAVKQFEMMNCLANQEACFGGSLEAVLGVGVGQ